MDHASSTLYFFCAPTIQRMVSTRMPWAHTTNYLYPHIHIRVSRMCVCACARARMPSYRENRKNINRNMVHHRLCCVCLGTSMHGWMQYVIGKVSQIPKQQESHIFTYNWTHSAQPVAQCAKQAQQWCAFDSSRAKCQSRHGQKVIKRNMTKTSLHSASLRVCFPGITLTPPLSDCHVGPECYFG